GGGCRLLAELRRRGLAAVEPARRPGPAALGAAARLRGGAGGGDPRPAAADRGGVRAGLVRRAGRQPAGGAVVEPGGGAAGAARGAGRDPASGLGPCRLAGRGLVLRSAVAAAGADRGQPAGDGLAARTALVRLAAGA